MGAFRDAKKRIAKTPGRILKLEPWVFADDWSGKPKDAVVVGLRLMSDGDKSKARSAAEAMAFELHAKGGVNAMDAFNDHLVRQCAALGICSPNDAEQPAEILPAAEEQVGAALTTRGARFIFDAIHRYEVESSPLNPEATDEELVELQQLIEGGALGDLGAEGEATARRFLRYVLDDLRAVTAAEETE